MPQVPGDTPGEPPAKAEPGLLGEQVGRLRTALERGGLDDSALEALERAVRGTSAVGLLKDLRQALDDFDFDQALRLLDQLLLHLQDEENTPS